MQGALYALSPRRRFHVRTARGSSAWRPSSVGTSGVRSSPRSSSPCSPSSLLTVLRVPNALALAAFAGFTDVIPFVGGILATAPAVLASLSRGPGVTIAILVLMVAYQEFESRFLDPRIYGREPKLPSAGVLVALLIGGRLGRRVRSALRTPHRRGPREHRQGVPGRAARRRHDRIPPSRRRTRGPSGPTPGAPRERTPRRPRRPRSRWPSGARLAESVR